MKSGSFIQSYRQAGIPMSPSHKERSVILARNHRLDLSFISQPYI